MELESLLDEFDLEETCHNIESIELLKIVNRDFILDPKPYHDCIGNRLNEKDMVIYSDKDFGPRPGILLGFDETGEFCAISYDGHNDCCDRKGNLIYKDITYKCLKVTNEDIIKLYKK